MPVKMAVLKKAMNRWLIAPDWTQLHERPYSMKKNKITLWELVSELILLQRVLSNVSALKGYDLAAADKSFLTVLAKSLFFTGYLAEQFFGELWGVNWVWVFCDGDMSVLGFLD